MIGRVGLNKLAEQLLFYHHFPQQVVLQDVPTAANKSMPCGICKTYVMRRNVNIYFVPTEKQKAPEAGTQQQMSSSASWTTITSKDWQNRRLNWLHTLQSSGMANSEYADWREVHTQS